MPQKKIDEKLSQFADAVDQDHEIQMARAELYKIADYALKLHNLLKNVPESEGIEAWQQSKITKAADYIGSVYHSLSYDKTVGNATIAPIAPVAAESKKTKFKSAMSESEVARYKSLLEKATTKAQQKLLKKTNSSKS